MTWTFCFSLKKWIRTKNKRRKTIIISFGVVVSFIIVLWIVIVEWWFFRNDNRNTTTTTTTRIIHVIQTRFMQNQPHLYHLGKARLELLKSITIPSMQHQTVPSFVWIIRTDPNLDMRLKTQLLQALQPLELHLPTTSNDDKHNPTTMTQHELFLQPPQFPVVVLIASNENPEGFRGNGAIADITQQSILLIEGDGDDETTRKKASLILQYMRHVHQLAQTHILLESRLDADDALAVDFVETVQNDALRYNWNATTTTASSSMVAPLSLWRVWCAHHHFEWQYDSPWTELADEQSHNPTTVANNNNHLHNNETGAILGIATGHCITPGLTWGYAPGVHRADIPIPSKHYRISQLLPPCQNNDDNEHDQQQHLFDQTQCYVQLGGQIPLAFRARTPTSAGMEAVYLRGYTTEKQFSTKAVRHSKFASQQNILFQSLPTLFGISPQELWSVRKHIANHLPLIALDALHGQCTKGHSCKKSSKRILQKIIANAAAAKQLKNHSHLVANRIEDLVDMEKEQKSTK
jgi:hypothetical protein